MHLPVYKQPNWNDGLGFDNFLADHTLKCRKHKGIDIGIYWDHVESLWHILFFSHTPFCRVARWSLKNITGRKTVFILARHQICTVHETFKNQSRSPGRRLGMVESGSGSVRSWPSGGARPFHHWWRHLLGWRAATMRRLACQHGTTGKWGLWQLLVAGAWGVDCALVCCKSRDGSGQRIGLSQVTYPARRTAATQWHLFPSLNARVCKRGCGHELLPCHVIST